LARPEANGPFLVYDVPGFEGAKAGTEVVRAFYILLKIDPRFQEMDSHINFYTARAVGATVHFKVPAWPFCLFPSASNQSSDAFWTLFTSQVPAPVAKTMNHVHSVFEGTETATQEFRKWTTVILDFSRVKGVGHLSSKAVFEQADDLEFLDFEYITIPIDPENEALGEEAYLGYRVGVIPPEGEGARKVNRTGQAKSKIAQKLAAKAAAAEAAARGQPAGARGRGAGANAMDQS
jgi:hypothetical protein